MALASEPLTKRKPRPTVPPPLSTTTGREAVDQSGSVVASMMVACKIVGSAPVKLIVCAPLTKESAMLKLILSAPPGPFGELFAAVIASRKLIRPSGPPLA